MSLEQPHSEIRNIQTTLVGLRTRMAQLQRLRETDPQKWETMYGQTRIQIHTLEMRVANLQALQHSQAPRPHTLENRQQTSFVHAQQLSQASRPQMHSCSQPESANVASAALPQPLPGK